MIWMLCLTTLALFGSLQAEPQQWAEEGLAARATKPIFDISSATRADGYSIAVWSQSQGGVPVVLGQLVAPGGASQWEEGGRLLAQGSARAAYPTVTAVDDGWVIAWFDADYITWCDRLDGGWCIQATVRAIKVDDTGAPTWSGGRAGLEIVPNSMSWYELQPYSVFPSSDGGAYVTWWMGYGLPLYAVSISAAGDIAWPTPVQMTPRLQGEHVDRCSDLQGGLLVTWSQVYAEFDTIVHANRLLPTGELAWADTSGLDVYSNGESFYRDKITADGTGGAFVVWDEGIDGALPTAQRISAAGELMWPESGVTISDIQGTQGTLALAPSFANGNVDGVLVLIENFNESYRLVLNKLSLTGVRSWGTEGLILCPESQGWQYFNESSIISDGLSGAICYYDRILDSPYRHHDLYATRILGNGTFRWEEACGILVDTSDVWEVVLSAPGLSGENVQSFLFDNGNENGIIRSQQLNFETGAPLHAEPVTLEESGSLSANNPIATQLGAGSTAVVWESYIANAGTVLFFQILDVFGRPMFDDEEGRPLAMNSEGQPVTAKSCALCPDGTGGFFAAFRSDQPSGYSNVLAVHLDASGQHLGNPQGAFVTDSLDSWSEADLFVVPDGAGGCYISTPRYDGNYILRSSTVRIGAQCELLWDEAVTFRANNMDVASAGLVAGPDHSCFATYSKYAYPNYGLNIARLSAEGVVEWDVEIVDTIAYPQGAFVTCGDAHNGVYMVWRDEQADNTEFKVMAQRIAPDGELLWGEHGLVVQDSNTSPVYPTCASDGLGNLTIAWTLWEYDGSDIFGQRLTPEGVMLWPENGLPVSAAQHDQSDPKLAVISDNEVYVVWQDMRSSETYWQGSKIYATHLNARGEIGDDSYWIQDGNPVCEAGYLHTKPVMVADGAGGVMVAWTDQRTGFDYWHGSVFAQRLYDPIFTDADETPVIPTEFSLSQNYPNPFNPETVIEFALPTSSKATMKVFDVTGRTVATLLDEPLTAGLHRVNFNAQSFASGVYFYTLRAADHTMTKKMVLLK